MTAEVLRVDSRGYVMLSVLECKNLSSKNILPLEPIKEREVIRKQRSTMGREAASA